MNTLKERDYKIFADVMLSPQIKSEALKIKMYERVREQVSPKIYGFVLFDIYFNMTTLIERITSQTKLNILEKTHREN